MKISSTLKDNITELLFKIIEFTQTRQKLLIRNINNMQTPGFLPKDLVVDEFADSINEAIKEHLRNQRLLLRDTTTIKFGAGGSFQAIPVIDEYAEKLLKKNPDEYLELQINKLLENSLNQRIAAEISMQKQKDHLSF
jgi:flagellar basal body rod protein FlgB